MSVLEAMVKALAILDANEALPMSIEVTQEVFDKLRSECRYPTEARGTPNSLLGVCITVAKPLADTDKL